MSEIKLLDCTLRDGGHVVEGFFGERVIKSVLQRLVDTKIDIIEAGFLMESYDGADYARFKSINDFKKIMPEDRGSSIFSLMADCVDLSGLEDYDGTVDVIRLSFKRNKLEWGLKTAKILMDKGYKVYINPVNCNVYTDYQYLKVIEEVNDLAPFGFSIVDTFGVFRKNDLSHKYHLVENNLDKDITIGLHLHENFGLAFSMAQHFTEIRKPTRNVTIDGSLIGMGRIPGNLCIEQIMDFMNNQFGANYVTEYAYDAIDDHIALIKDEIPWGYSIPYALSAKAGLHRTYAEYLMDKGRLKTKEIQRILSLVGPDKIEDFDKEHIEDLYKAYINVELDDAEGFECLSNKLNSNVNNIIILAPGASIDRAKSEITSVAGESDACVIAVNFIPDFVSPHFVFCANSKRLELIEGANTGIPLIVTSNLTSDRSNFDYVISYNELAYFDEVHCEDSTLLLLHLLLKIGVKHVKLAGFDGFSDSQLSFYKELYNKRRRPDNPKENNDKILDIIRKHFSTSMKLEFLTRSSYEVE